MEQKYSGKAVILDDDVIFCEILKNLLEPLFQKYFLSYTIDIFQNSDEFEKSGQSYDLCFMDVVLKDEDGINLVENWKYIGKIKNVIYVSAYDRYVFRSFGSQPVFYVRKAHLQNDLDEALCLYHRTLQKLAVAIPEGNKTHFLEPAKILYLYSNRHYIDVYLADGNILVIRGKMDDMEKYLNRYDFIRIHVSYLVNVKYIRNIRKNQILMVNLKEFNISNKYRERVSQALKKYLSGK